MLTNYFIFYLHNNQKSFRERILWNHQLTLVSFIIFAIHIITLYTDEDLI